MEHIKLMVRRQQEPDGFWAIVDEETHGGKFFVKVYLYERAKRFVLCWNEHDKLIKQRDALLEACQEALECLQQLAKDRVCSMQGHITILEQAIAEAEK